MKHIAFVILALAACTADSGSSSGGDDTGSAQGSGSDGGSDSGSGTGTPTGEPAELYAANCAACHGDHGEGNADGPQIQNPVHAYATYVVRNGRAVQMTDMGYTDPMPKITTADMSDADLTSVLDWLSQSVHPTDGQGLFVRFCANCHGQMGTGGRVGKNIKLHADEASQKIRSGEGGTSYGARTKYMPKWSTTELTNAEVQLIVTWLQAS